MILVLLTGSDVPWNNYTAWLNGTETPLLPCYTHTHHTFLIWDLP